MNDNNYGFTLIELLVSTAVMVILGAGFLGLQFIYSQNQTSAWQNYKNIEESNRTLFNINRELRNAQTGEDGSYPLVTANDQEIIFFSDPDNDGKSERVRYTRSGTQLVRGVIEPVGEPANYPLAEEISKVVAENVRNGAEVIFTYYNSDWPTDTTNNPLPLQLRISDTRMVKVKLMVNVYDDPDSDFIIESNVLIRVLQES